MRNRKSVRLKGYDYSKSGLYFITICVKNRECLFGNIVKNEMILNAIGEIAHKNWMTIPEHFQNTILHQHIIMPDHVHGIIELSQSNVGECHGIKRTRHGVSLRCTNQQEFGKPVNGSLSVIINQYKSTVKRWCNKNNFRDFQWQSRFFDHIIRSEDDYLRISEYIRNNPVKWNNDIF